LAQLTVVPEKQNWSDANIISSVSNSSKSSHSNEKYDYASATRMWPKLTDVYPQSKPKVLRPPSQL
jgi:hypothetical protein